MPDLLTERQCGAWRIWVLAVVAWSLVPYKAWTRAITGSEGFNLGDLALLVIALPALGYLLRQTRKDRMALWLGVVLAIVVVSFFKGMLAGESFREMARVIRANLFWLAVPLMMQSITDFACLSRLLKGFKVLLLIASAMIVVFSFAPSLIPQDDEVAQFRMEMFGGFERVFTLGMWAVFAGAVFGVSALILDRGRSLSKSLFLGAMLLGLAFTFSRTFFLTLGVALAILLFLSGNRGLRKLVAVGGGLAVVVAAFGLPAFLEDLFSAVAGRTAMFATESPDFAFQTFIWRLSEADAAFEQMRSTADMLFGVMGRIYSLPDSYDASVPHISYLGMLYAHGLLGVAGYAGLIIAATSRLWRNLRACAGSELYWLPAGAFAAWICLLVGAISAPVFQMTWGVSVLAFVVGISEVTTNITNSSKTS